ncbi:MAG: hypothetical protein ACKO7N_05225 [Candidatus Nitrosotenuis sp.]
MVKARNSIPKFLKADKIKDEGCPTCGSMDFGIVEIKKSDSKSQKKLQCYNCKKFWYI